MEPVLSLLIGYICGMFLTALIVIPHLVHQDPTQVGSGNPGTANVGAQFGKGYGILTLAGDLLKSGLAFLLVWFIFHSHFDLAICGLGLILGHCFPAWNQFKGGKGVAVAALWSVVIDWKAGLFTLLIALLLVIIMKNLSVPPLVFLLLFSLWQFKTSWQLGCLFLAGTLVMVVRFWPDVLDFVHGQGKRVDILTTIKKKLGIKVN